MDDSQQNNNHNPAAVIPYIQHHNSGIIRQKPEDFIVEEIPLFQPAGEGEHLWLKIRKINANTDWVAGQLAKWLGVKRQDVGFAGLKDRNAVTTQWFSIYLPGKQIAELQHQIPEQLADSISILEQTRHQKKLRRGVLKGNHFNITIREFAGDAASMESTIKILQARGIPNYFGAQRFGHNHQNIQHASDWFSGKRKPKNRQQRSIYLSAARSLIFNQILAERVTQNNWDKALTGDIFMLQGSHSWFQDNINEKLSNRIKNFDIHPSGALWGRGELQTTDSAAQLELSIAQQHSQLCQGLEKHGLKHERRALRVAVPDLTANWLDEATLRICFTLPAGAYATVLVSHLCKMVGQDRQSGKP